MDVFFKGLLAVVGETPITFIANVVYWAAEEEMKLVIKGVCLNGAQNSSWTDYYTAFVFP